MNGEKVDTLQRLMELAQEKRAVSCAKGPQRMPAAFMIGMPGNVIYKFIQSGLYVYEKESKTNGNSDE